jgi:hypothetical protein
MKYCTINIKESHGELKEANTHYDKTKQLLTEWLIQELHNCSNNKTSENRIWRLNTVNGQDPTPVQSTSDPENLFPEDSLKVL